MAVRLLRALIALAVCLAVPGCQLRWTPDAPTCCCPDPAKCPCHDHDRSPGEAGTAKMRACHSPSDGFALTELASFVVPDMAARPTASPIADVAHDDLARPHPAPPPDQPDAPS